MRFGLAVILGALAMGPAQARPVVVEMFTSLACSSCPPADALLGQIAASDPDILPLSFNVTYWNNLGWPDPLGLDGSTARQSWYAGLQNSQNVYTPEAVVDGGAQLVGSDRDQVLAAIRHAKQAASTVPVSVTGGPMITVNVGAGTAQKPTAIWLFGFDASRTTAVGGGENGGATITEVNVVRSIATLGKWIGASESFTIPHPAGDHVAVLLQQEDGTILGAASD
jgi:hypothetical protein